METTACWCGRAAAYGTERCYWHGARRLEVQLASDRRRLEAAVASWRGWLVELEGRWVALGQAPGRFWALVLEGREAEVAEWVERAEAGW